METVSWNRKGEGEGCGGVGWKSVVGRPIDKVDTLETLPHYGERRTRKGRCSSRVARS